MVCSKNSSNRSLLSVIEMDFILLMGHSENFCKYFPKKFWWWGQKRAPKTALEAESISNGSSKSHK